MSTYSVVKRGNMQQHKMPDINSEICFQNSNFLKRVLINENSINSKTQKS